MRNFKALVLFELKKILNRKFTWIAFGIVFGVMVAFGFYRAFASHEMEGIRITAHEEEMQLKEEYKKIDGRVVDDALVDEMLAAMGTEEFTRYEDLYKEVVDDLCGSLEGATSVAQVKEALGVAQEEELLYTLRRARIEKNMESMLLSEREKEYWREVLSKEDTPWAYEYHRGVQYAWVAVYTAVVLIALMIAVSLANLFSEEHQRKTDQLVLCSRNGKCVLYGAKITAGMLFTFVATGLVLMATALPDFIMFGADGLKAPIQIFLPTCTYLVTFGEMLLYVYVVAMIAALLYASITMCCSELFRNSTVAVMALIVVLVLVPMMVVVPYEYRVLSQIFELNPISVLAIWGSFDLRLVPVFGGYLTMRDVAPVLYILLIGIFTWIGSRAYRSYQVSGR